MNQLTPRWEWRIFAKDLSSITKSLTDFPSITFQKSHEIYLISEQCTKNIKIRHNMLDIKKLLAVNKCGFEQWIPSLKAPFPLQEDVLASLFQALSIPHQPKKASQLSMSDLLERIKSYDHITLIFIEKARKRFVLYDCFAEYSHIVCNGSPCETIALEHEDDNLLYQSLQKMGWDSLKNKNYLSFLKELIKVKTSGEGRNEF
ncbi:MAG: hypothetical protein PHE86_06020 [Candidatus Marinimicrobia bacterium]|nr:hypothetical protein [Candidatus Neomarinimicrobiota bacterium]MDD5581623.1 hypothetical protein [Candidatus Neomarinimicrobiota bacterium]